MCPHTKKSIYVHCKTTTLKSMGELRSRASTAPKTRETESNTDSQLPWSSAGRNAWTYLKTLRVSVEASLRLKSSGNVRLPHIRGAPPGSQYEDQRKMPSFFNRKRSKVNILSYTHTQDICSRSVLCNEGQTMREAALPTSYLTLRKVISQCHSPLEFLPLS